MVVGPHSLLGGDRLVAGLEHGLDRRRALRKRPALLWADADQLPAAVALWAPLHAEPVGEVALQFGLEDRP